MTTSKGPQPITIRNYRLADHKGKHLHMMAYWHYVNPLLCRIVENGIEGYAMDLCPMMGSISITRDEDEDCITILYATPFDDCDGVARETIAYGLLTQGTRDTGDILGENGEVAVDWTGNIARDAELYHEAMLPLIARLLPHYVDGIA